jgi:hypothetical protein
MSQPESKDQGSKQDEKKTQELHVTVDSEQMKMLLETQRKLEDEKKAALEAAVKAEAEKKAAEEKATKLEEETEDYKGKLDIIAKKEFEKKRTAILDKAKTLIQDEARMKEIEAKLTDPEQLKATEYLISVLDDSLKKGEEAHKIALEAERKKAEEDAKAGTPPTTPAGTMPLSPAQTGSPQGGYDSVEAMIRDLRKREKSPDPQIAAEAKAILDEMFKKWCFAIKKEYNEMRGFKAEQDEKIKQPSLKEVTKKNKGE